MRVRYSVINGGWRVMAARPKTAIKIWRMALRDMAEGKDSLMDLAVEATKKALEMADVDPDDVDLVLMYARRVRVPEHFALISVDRSTQMLPSGSNFSCPKKNKNIAKIPPLAEKSVLLIIIICSCRSAICIIPSRA